jgi:formylglycine-generating enzyme required for sulfatase activity
LTEAEWEYAARAGTTTPFSTGRTITPDQANFDGLFTYPAQRPKVRPDSARALHRNKTIEVGSFASNAFGLHDMPGNVWELVQDCYKENCLTDRTW